MDDFDIKIDQLGKSVSETLEKNGIYLSNMVLTFHPTQLAQLEDKAFLDKVAAEDFASLFETGEVKMVFNFEAYTKDVAFSDRVLEPEQWEQDQQIRKELPSENEVTMRFIQEELEREWGGNDEETSA